MIKTLLTSNIALIAFLSIGIIFLLVGLTAKKTNDPLEKSKAIASFYDLKRHQLMVKRLISNNLKAKKY